jgi:hypothetical protein
MLSAMKNEVRMTAVRERLFVDAPYTQTVVAVERRLGLAPGKDHGTWVLTLTLPIGEDRELARVVSATSERTSKDANYASRYGLRWDAGRTGNGIPTPGFAGTLSVGAGEDYNETRLELEGSYEPPGGVVGRAFDDLVGRRLAHATLTGLLSGVGEELRADHERIERAKRGDVSA